MYDLTTARLALDHLDRVFAVTDDAREFLGHIDSDPSWPARLGPEPRWFLTELAELLDAWEDAGRFSAGCAAEGMAAFDQSRGV